ncbi:hypothetical protein Ndes2526B_g01610 [Nannochloris sp. 'desiccata']|nr:hypothetical protein KSW81_005891 [Chlorella desiccata (nom. nud.)]KAH7623189.1 hypothetical protein NADE_002383 [Chlorella desiccata (nom. nud.)]
MSRINVGISLTQQRCVSPLGVSAAPSYHVPLIASTVHRREILARTTTTGATIEINPVVDLSIQNVAYEHGTFSITGKLLSPVHPDIVYNVLTDYNALPRVFHNVEECSIQWSDDGTKQLSQRCSWRFLVFRGSFVTDLAVTEGEEARTLEFSLVKSTFMRKFVGSWEIRPCSVTGGSEIWHSLAVQPALAPPQKIGVLTTKIFGSQVEGILRDLAVELHRCSIDTDDDHDDNDANTI